MRRTLVVMVKQPRSGRVKTRLGRDIGMVPAAWWYRHHLSRLLHAVADPRWRLVTAHSPDNAPLEHRDVAESWPQGRGDLGLRMMRALRRGGPKTVLIGSDIEGVTAAHIGRAFSALGTCDGVLGPAPDGGFWLLGLKHPSCTPVAALNGCRWSSKFAMEDTAQRLPGRIGYADILRDIDTADDLSMTTPGLRATSAV